MKNKKKKETTIPDEKSNTIDKVWWLEKAEWNQGKILGELATGNFACTLKEIYSYLQFLTKEYAWADSILVSILRGLSENQQRATIEEWNTIILNSN